MFKKKLALAIGILVASTVPVLYSRPVFANPPRTVGFSIGQPVTLNAGDTANVTVILTTTDPNEDGEGEGVVISGAAGGLACGPMAVTDYFVPHVLQCGPVPFGDQLTLNSSYLGYDGDEIAFGNADINTPDAIKKSQQYIDSLDKLAHADDFFAQTYDAASFVCSQGVISAVICAYLTKTNWSSLASFMRGNGYALAALAADPPDSNYTQIFQPILQYDPPMVFSGTMPQKVADDLNALYLNSQEQAGLLFAIYTSFNRASGALQAGMTNWQGAQVAAAAKYSYQLGAVLKLEPGLSGTLQQDFVATGVTVPTVTSGQVYALEQGFLTNGLPSDELATLAKIGFNSTDQQQITNLSFVQSTTEVASMLSSSDGSSWFANASRNAEIMDAAASLQQFALSNGYSPIDCSKATSSVSAIWPPNHKMVPVGINGVTDPDGSSFTIAVTSIQQDEPLSGGEVDGSGLGTPTAEVRAERNGNGNGRVYQIGFTAEDASGATCNGSVIVSVPHDQHHPAVDNGQRYNSTNQ